MSERDKIPVGTKLAACLILLGFDLDEPIEWHHSPPIAQRAWDGRAYDPPANDPYYIVPMGKAAHRKRTAEIDIPAIAKTKRITKAQEEFRTRMLAKSTGEPAPPRKGRQWPKRAFQSRRTA